MFGKRSPQSGYNGFHDFDSAKMLIIGFDQCPGRVGSAGRNKHILRGLGVFLIATASSPIGLRQARFLESIRLDILQTSLLLWPGYMKPKLNQDESVIAQLAFELTDFMGNGVSLLPAHLPVYPIFQERSVPGTVEEQEIALSGEAGPKSPEEWPENFLLIGFSGRVNLEPTGIKRVDQIPDGVAFAGGIPALE
jgi:hypothetical protein